ncbi:MAG: response regulator [Eubacteriales bacterium]
MYDVVIIDDEPRIVEGLSKVINWESLDCRVVATASDGKEGAEVIQEKKPHILLTDVNMPDVDGLEMLRALRSEFPQLQVTIISGHSDFSFAQEAMRLGACRYLLKPTKLDEIYEAITVMKENLESMDSVEAPEVETDPKSQKEESDSSEASNFVLTQALSYIKEHHSEKLTLPQVAEHCYVSQWHLSKLLNGQLKKNFYEVLNEIRIEKAKELLTDGSLRISEISEMVGYGEATHFSRVFKKEVGISANEYRGNLNL